MSYSLKPAALTGTLVERLLARSTEIDNRLGPIPGPVADRLVSELLDAAHAIDTKVHGDVAEALTQALQYFDNRADVNDGDYGVPDPNTEMKLAQLCRDALKRIDG